MSINLLTIVRAIYVPGPTFTVTGLLTVIAPVADDVCEDCGSDLAPLVDNEGNVRTMFCEACEFGY
ncbi:hypothetical protein ACIOHS_27140 [Streptomyces sp. NPDC088253]|uniref:hypothetical protein n=1 Tax=Streptomyces sp. NPDC088253 TaxID=3365846 RepID=UPI0037F8F091